MKKYIIIKADTNDADYITEKREISDEKIELMKPIIKAIKECKAGHNWPRYNGTDEEVEELYENILTNEQIDLFDNYRPHGEWGIHSIESIEILEVINEIKLL